MKFCGLVFFGLLLAGICPTRQVELEGLVPNASNIAISISYNWQNFNSNELVTNVGTAAHTVLLALNLDASKPYYKITKNLALFQS